MVRAPTCFPVFYLMGNQIYNKEELSSAQILEIRKHNFNLKFIKEEDIDLNRYFGLIYITIFPNKMIYVGYTQRIPGTIFYENYYGSSTSKHFKGHLKLCKEKITKKILFVVYNNEIKSNSDLFHYLEKMELCFHKSTKCIYREIGYNKMTGADVRTRGEGNVAKDPEVRMKMRQVKRKKVSKATRLKHSRDMKGNSHATGTKHTQEWIEQHTFKGERNGNYDKTWKMMNNGVEDRKVRDENKLPKGWIFGRLLLTDEVKQRLSISHKNSEKVKNNLRKINKEKLGSRWMYKKGEKSITIKKKFIKEKLQQGWRFGRSAK